MNDPAENKIKLYNTIKDAVHDALTAGVLVPDVIGILELSKYTLYKIADEVRGEAGIKKLL